MATTAVLQTAPKGNDIDAGSWQSARALLVCSTLPPGLFGLAHLVAEASGLMPLFFTPFGLPNWLGAAAHLSQLGLLGAAYWAVTQRVPASPARFWLIALGTIYLALPFLTPVLDSVALAMLCTAIMLLVLATAARVGAVSRLAGWLLAPMLALVGLSAATGLAVAAYAPPFALTQTQQAPPAT